MNTSSQVIVDAVWNEIAENIGDSLPTLIYEKVRKVLGDDIDDDVIESTFKEVARSMGPLAFD